MSPEAKAFYDQADQPLARKLAGRFRYRIGDWRVVYRIDDRAREVHVLVIARRSEVYE